MERDDDDGIGYVRESHYLKSPSLDRQQAIALLQVPRGEGREGSISSSVSDLDVPIYSSENLTTSSKREPQGVSQRLKQLDVICPPLVIESQAKNPIDDFIIVPHVFWLNSRID
ncbi:unnamed protein product [Phaedon cochleariae]|uniref:Uncharacterized protein n=1 Tax=Phaedon cochleariae TaxID=80249 RepID=A0A9N9SL03_PHACE|nr:unnamed protein product [Phaedon cochleariae]